MVQTTVDIDVDCLIKRYVENLSNHIYVDGVFLFGSAARGEMTKHSDVDVIVLSKDFAQLNFMDRLQFLSQARWGCATDVAMDIFGYTPQEFAEFDQSDSHMLKKLKREGRYVYGPVASNTKARKHLLHF